MLLLDRSFFVLGYQNTFPHKMDDVIPHICYKHYLRFMHMISSHRHELSSILNDWLAYLYIHNHRTFKEELYYLKNKLIVNGVCQALNIREYNDYFLRKYQMKGAGNLPTSLHDMMYMEAMHERYYYQSLFFYPLVEQKLYNKIHYMLERYRSYEPLIKHSVQHRALTLIHFLHYKSHHFYQLKDLS